MALARNSRRRCGSWAPSCCSLPATRWNSAWARQGRNSPFGHRQGRQLLVPEQRRQQQQRHPAGRLGDVTLNASTFTGRRSGCPTPRRNSAT
jgi:hypothetical protein